MKIETIVCHNKKVFAFNPEAISLVTFLSNIEVNTTYYLIASHNNRFYASDLLKVYNSIGNGCMTWNQLNAKLTEGLLLGAATKIPYCHYMWDKKDNRSTTSAIPDGVKAWNLFQETKSVKIHSFDKTFDIEADFGSRNEPDVRNLTNYKFRLRDVVFRKKDTHVVINFQNTIPIVNGVSVTPLYYAATDELFAPETVKYLPPSSNKNIILVDFSDIGSFEIIKLSDCTRQTPHRHDIVTIKLPGNKTLANKSVILVIGGRWYLQNEFHRCSDQMVSFYPKQSLHNALIANRIYSKDYNNLFTITTSNMEYHLDYTMWKPDSYTDFIIVINHPNVNVLETAIGTSDESISELSANTFKTSVKDSYRNIFLTHPSGEKKGLLMRTVNKDIVDFVQVNKHSKDILMTLPSTNVVIPDIDLGYVENTNIKTYGEKIANSSFVLKDIYIEV